MSEKNKPRNKSLKRDSYESLLDFITKKTNAENSKFYIFCHSSPDPDCMASAMALKEIASLYGYIPHIYYGGEINHSQNKAMINVFDIPITDISSLDPESLEEVKEGIYNENNIVSIVDTSHFYGSGNSQYTKVLYKEDKNPKIDIIIDHHDETIWSDKCKINLNKKTGSCSSIFVEIINFINNNYNIDANGDSLEDSLFTPSLFTPSLSTLLYLGLMKDTDELNAKHILTEIDEKAYSFLKEKIDLNLYIRVINCPKPRILIDLEGIAKNKYVTHEGNCIISGVGFIKSPHRALLAEICDDLMTHDQIEKSVVMGIIDDGIGSEKYLSASFRSSGDVVDADKFIKKIFGKDGSGGRKGAAGANIPLDSVLSKTIDSISDSDRHSLFNIIYKAYTNEILQEIQL